MTKKEFLMPDGNIVQYQWWSHCTWWFELSEYVTINRVLCDMKGSFTSFHRVPQVELWRVGYSRELKTPKSAEVARKYIEPFTVFLQDKAEVLQTTLKEEAIFSALKRVEEHLKETLALRSALLELGESIDGVKLESEKEYEFANKLQKVYYTRTPTALAVINLSKGIGAN